MGSHRTLVLVAVGLLVLGVVSIGLQPVLDPRPAGVCVDEGEPSSGFRDAERDCNISIESWEEIADWEGKPKPLRIVGALLILGGLVVGVVALVRGRRGPGGAPGA